MPKKISNFVIYGWAASTDVEGGTNLIIKGGKWNQTYGGSDQYNVMDTILGDMIAASKGGEDFKDYYVVAKKTGEKTANYADVVYTDVNTDAKSEWGEGYVTLAKAEGSNYVRLASLKTSFDIELTVTQVDNITEESSSSSAD